MPFLYWKHFPISNIFLWSCHECMCIKVVKSLFWPIFKIMNQITIPQLLPIPRLKSWKTVIWFILWRRGKDENTFWDVLTFKKINIFFLLIFQGITQLTHCGQLRTAWKGNISENSIAVCVGCFLVYLLSLSYWAF